MGAVMSFFLTKIKTQFIVYQDILRLLMPIFRSLGSRFKRQTLFGFIALLFSNLLNTISPFFLKDIIESTRTPLALSTESLMLLGIFYAGTWSLGQILSQVKELIVIPIMGRMKTTLSKQLFSSILNTHMCFFKEKSVSQLGDPLFRVEEIFPLFFSGIFFYFLPICLELFFIFLMISYLLPIQFLFIFLLIIISYFTYTLFSVVGLSHKLDVSIQKSEYMRADLCDRLINFESIKSHCQESFENKRFANNYHALEKARVSSESAFEWLRLGQNCILSIGMFFIVLLGLDSVATKRIDVGTFILLIAYLYQIIGPLTSLGTIIKDVKEGTVVLYNSLNLIKIPSEKEHETLERPSHTFDEVTFTDVNFSYATHTNTLQNISFSLKKGEVKALVGRSGSGKTTLARLLLKYYDPSTGEIQIDGNDINLLPASFIRNTIGYVNQEALLFRESILANLRYGNPEATFQEIEKVLDIVSLKEFVLSLPDNYETIVGERGTYLSGGQRQRLNIARVLLSKKSLYIFDEATSAIDSSTQQKIYSHIHALSKNSAVLIISHRLHEIQGCDQILVLEKGHIIEQGTHEDLLAHKGKYSMLWESRTRSAPKN